MKKIAGLLLLAVTTFGFSGCGTVANCKMGHTIPYGGVMCDGVVAVMAPAAGPAWAPLSLLAIADLPLSLAADTVTLPYTLSKLR